MKFCSPIVLEKLINSSPIARDTASIYAIVAMQKRSLAAEKLQVKRAFASSRAYYVILRPVYDDPNALFTLISLYSISSTDWFFGEGQENSKKSHLGDKITLIDFGNWIASMTSAILNCAPSAQQRRAWSSS